MASKTITQRIGLEGGREIRTQLESLGKAGAAAFRNFQDAANANPAIARLTAQLEALRQKAVEVGRAASRLGTDFQSLEASVVSSARKFTLVAAAVTAVVGGFGLLVKGAADAADTLATTAESLGLTTEQLSNLRFAAAQENIGFDQLVAALARVEQAMGQVAEEDNAFRKRHVALNRELDLGRITIEEYRKRLRDMKFEASQSQNIFDKLGVSVKNSSGEMRDTMSVFKSLADAFKALPEGANKTALGIELLSRRNIRLIPLLNQGSAGLNRQFAEARRVAPAFSELAQKVGKELSDAFDRLKFTSSSAKNAIELLFAPAQTRLANALTESIVANRARMFEFATTIATRVTPVVDDLIALLEGREVRNGFILQARDAMVAFGTATQRAVTQIIIPALQALLAALQGVATAINAVFGTNLTGGQIAVALIITKLIGLFGVLRAAVFVVVAAVKLLAVAFGGVTVAIAAIGFAIGFFTVRAIQQIGSVSNAWNKVWSGIQALVLGALRLMQARGEVVAAFLESMWDVAVAAVERAAAGITSLFATAWGAVTAGATTALQAIVSLFTGLPAALTTVFAFVVSSIQTAWRAILTGAQELGARIVAAFNATVQAVVAFFVALPGQLQAAFASLVSIATGAWDAIVAKATEITSGIVAAFNSAIQRVTGFLGGLRDRAFSILESIAGRIRSVVDAINGATNAGGGEGFAGGGLIRGAGTGTSDSIPIWASNREYVMRRKAVDHWGIGFMNAINNLRNPFGALAARFKDGGLVDGLAGSFDSLMPRAPGFAPVMAGAGGGNKQPVTFVIGGEKFPVVAGEDVVKSLMRYSMRKQISSAGRKPTWYGS